MESEQHIAANHRWYWSTAWHSWHAAFLCSKICLDVTGDTAGEAAAEPTEQQQGGGEVIENSDAPEAPENPDGYLAEEGGAGAEGGNESEAVPAKV